MARKSKGDKVELDPIPAERLFRNELVYEVLYKAVPIEEKVKTIRRILEDTQEQMCRFK